MGCDVTHIMFNIVKKGCFSRIWTRPLFELNPYYKLKCFITSFEI